MRVGGGAERAEKAAWKMWLWMRTRGGESAKLCGGFRVEGLNVATWSSHSHLVAAGWMRHLWPVITPLLQSQCDGELRNTAHTRRETTSTWQFSSPEHSFNVKYSGLELSAKVMPLAAQRAFSPEKCVTGSRVSVTFPSWAPDSGAGGFLY